ncbi:MAG TPA: hypothetical protein ENI85_04035, partial [Deltaproteobacteria bacterium]|nr:hypothetical protein [Deltaproteobacteria bacterium]
DIPVIKRTTRHIVGGPDDTSSPMTALGVYHGMRAAVEARFGKDDLDGLDVAIQGAGNVAWHLMSHLTEAGARIKVADVNPDALARARDVYDVEVVDPDEILFQQVDILAPCALGGVLNEKTIPRLQTKIICGCANNQLATSEDDTRLREKGLLYIPDYVVNAGGVIASTGIVAGATDDAIRTRVESIQDRCRQIIEKAMAEETGTEAAADSLAEEILRNAPA